MFGFFVFLVVCFGRWSGRWRACAGACGARFSTATARRQAADFMPTRDGRPREARFLERRGVSPVAEGKSVSRWPCALSIPSRGGRFDFAISITVQFDYKGLRPISISAAKKASHKEQAKASCPFSICVKYTPAFKRARYQMETKKYFLIRLYFCRVDSAGRWSAADWRGIVAWYSPVEWRTAET